MKLLFGAFAVITIITLLPLGGNAQQVKQDNITLRVKIYNFENNEGVARLALFKQNQEDSFPNDAENAFKVAKAPIEKRKATVVFKGLPNGIYAVAAIHDENENEKLDTNLIGMPKEGFGVSNDAKGTLGPPKFQDARFRLEWDKEIEIHLGQKK